MNVAQQCNRIIDVLIDLIADDDIDGGDGDCRRIAIKSAGDQPQVSVRVHYLRPSAPRLRIDAGKRISPWSQALPRCTPLPQPTSSHAPSAVCGPRHSRRIPDRQRLAVARLVAPTGRASLGFNHDNPHSFRRGFVERQRQDRIGRQRPSSQQEILQACLSALETAAAEGDSADLGCEQAARVNARNQAWQVACWHADHRPAEFHRIRKDDRDALDA